MVETNISFPYLVEMLKFKEQSIGSMKIAKQFQGTPLIAGATQPGRPSRLERTTTRDDNIA